MIEISLCIKGRPLGYVNEPAHSRSLARAFAVRTHKVWKKTKSQTKTQTSSSTDSWACAFE